MKDSDERPTARHAAAADEETTDVTAERLGPGMELGGYIIDGLLGQGGMGIVYAATHPLIGKRAAAKVLKPELSKEPAAVERFIREARAVNQIGHPNIVDIYDFGQLPDGRSYYLMDLLDGEPLRTKLKRGPLHVAEAACVIDETASALAAAHDKGIVHRDLKPENIFMVAVPGRWPEVKLLDWGLAKHLRGNGKFQTVTGSVMGTPVYMSPEQARGETVDHRTDIYALGVMAYELLAGAVPFKGRTSVDTLLAHQEEPVPSLATRVPELPDELSQLIEAMLAKDAGDRPTLAAVRAVLKRLRGTKIPTMTAAGLQMPRTISEELARRSSSEIKRPSTSELAADPESLSAQMTVPRLPIDPTIPQASASAQIPALPPPPSYPYPPSTPGSVAYNVPPSYGPQYIAQGSLPPQPLQFPSAAGLLPPEPAATQPSRRWLVIVVVAVVVTALGLVIALAI